MAFLAAVAMIAGSLYAFTHGHPALAGVLGGLAVVSAGGGLVRRRQKRKAADARPPT